MLTTPDTPADLDDPVVDSPRGRRGPSLPAWVAMGFVGAFALAVLIPGTSLLEPDDYAYRASILALSQGHLWLTNAQYLAMSHHFAVADGGHSLGITQWIHQADGTWISEKNPGYPFFAVIFQWLHLTRLIPVFYGALASVALYVGGRRWLGRWGGTLAVGLFLSSGAALVFGWRWTMPTFTDASLVAIGLGLLLWSCLAGDATRRRRGIVGAVGLLALDGAVFCRYTDVVVLGTVMVAIVLVSILAKEVIPRRQLAWWLGLQVLVGAGLLGINAVLYGSATKTGYSSGEITFSFHAISGNLSVMPSPLLRSMPMLVLALVAIVVAPILFVIRRRQPERRDAATRDLLIVAVLAVMFLGIFGLYFCYDWTAQMGGHTGGPLGGKGPGGGGSYVHLIRFYVPALAPMALLGAWLLTRIPTWLAFVVLAGLITMGAASYHTMATSGGIGGGFPGGTPGALGGLGAGGHRGTIAGCPSFPGGSSGFTPPGGGVGAMHPGSGAFTPPSGSIPSGGGSLPNIPKRCLPKGALAH